MRILFTRFPLESALGGAENQTMWLAEGLKNRGFDVGFLGSCPMLLECFRDAGFSAIGLQIGHPPVSMMTAASFVWRRKKMLRELIAAFEKLPQLPDTVCMLSLSEKILFTDWLTKRGVRVIWIEHDRVGRWLKSNPWLSELKRLSKIVTTVCVSELSRKIYVDLGFDEVRVVAIPNGIPFPPPPSGEGLGVVGVKRLHLGCISRLSPEKGVDILIQSLETLPEISLTIVGKGRDEAYLRQLIVADTQRMGGERITLESFVDDLDAFYASLDALVLPSSDHDPFGLVAAEAMMRGLPVIVTDACGIAGYLWNDEDALIVPAGSPRALTEAMKHISDPNVRSRLIRQGQKKAEEIFSLPRMVDRYTEIFSA